MIDAVEGALSMAFAMGWEILWPLILGHFVRSRAGYRLSSADE
jgi:hypothetical protein